MQGRHPLRPVDQALLTRTMLELLDPDPRSPPRDPGPREPGPREARTRRPPESQELDELVRAAYELPYGRAKSALLEQAVERAEAEGDDEAAFQYRVKLAFAYSEGGEPRLSFTRRSRRGGPGRRPGAVVQFRRSLLWATSRSSTR